MGVWDATTPAGTDLAREGDDRIREMKAALAEALSHEFSTFPGATPGSTPIFIPGFLRGATASRPTGDSLVEGRLYINTSTNVLERYNGSTWDTVFTLPADGGISTAKLAADCVTGAKIADDQVDSEHYVAGSIDNEHLSADCVNGNKIADDSIDSEHYADGSIDNEHLAASSVTSGKILTSTGSSSSSGSITMNDFCFFPSIASWASTDALASWSNGSSDPGDPTGRFGIGATQTKSTRWRYITSSDRPRLWVLIDEKKNIQGIWESEDPPNQTETDPELETNPFEGQLFEHPKWRAHKVSIVDLSISTKLREKISKKNVALGYKVFRRWCEDRPKWKMDMKGVKCHDSLMERIPDTMKNMKKLYYFRSLFAPMSPSLVIRNLMEFSPNDKKLVLKKDVESGIKNLVKNGGRI